MCLEVRALGGGKGRFMNPLLNSFNWIFQISCNTQIINVQALSSKLAAELLHSLFFFFLFCAHQHVLCGTGGNFVNIWKCQWEWLCTWKFPNFPKFKWCTVIMDVYRNQWEDLGDVTPTDKGMGWKVFLWKFKYMWVFSAVFALLLRQVSSPSCQFGWLHVQVCGAHNKLDHLWCMQEL